ncbi:MAG TPA: flagellar biosynthesis protein FlhF [Anaeromyxobacteraceae bacterium]|nr:flagellar biosynthesis protein FlhF [Anaeromyxobacteraceae bacterium]
MNATVRTFRGADSAQALAAAKKALGPDAVVLDARTVPGGVLKRAEVELTVALGPVPALAPAERPRPRPARPSGPPAAGPAARSAAAQEELSSDLRRLVKELGETRSELRLVALQTRAARELELPPSAAEVFSALTARGVEATLAEELVRQAMASKPLEGVVQGVRELVEERLLPCRAPWLHGDRQVVALVGPTGVGKTTTLAKIAARAILETKKKVALVTVDVYRIGAQEQLARYGEIMNVPVLVARDRSELGQAMERVRDADLVLIDTAGRSAPEDVARQADLVRSVPGVLLHLVVSAASGALELAAVAERYRALRPDRLVFSKVDESAGPGSILSAAVRIARPIACITDGQRVPEDLHPVSGRELVDLVAGNPHPPPPGRNP